MQRCENDFSTPTDDSTEKIIGKKFFHERLLLNKNNYVLIDNRDVNEIRETFVVFT